MRLLERLSSRYRYARHVGAVLAVVLITAVAVAELVPATRADARGILSLPSLTLPMPARGPGYQLATDTGDVVPFGAAGPGSTPDGGLANPVVAVARTRTGAGAWTATADGGVLTSGDAAFHGSLGGQHVNQPTVSLAATPSGGGYWLAAADGGVFSFGDAGFHGSLVGTHLNTPVVELVPTPSGAGYWLATADGGVFSFGDAGFHGSVTGPLQAPVTAMAATPSGAGYWLAAADGGIFAFGDAGFHGRPGAGDLHAPVVGMATSLSGQGYWLASSDGGVFTFGDAPFLGSSTGKAWGQVVGIAAGRGRLVARDVQVLAPRIRNRYGNDISWPQCDGASPAPGYGFGVVGVTGGRPFTRNRCLADQWRWATRGPSAGGVYVNVASPTIGEPAAMTGPAGSCAITDLPCQTYNHSANNINDALAYARASGVDAPLWWLDVEVLNRWSTNPALNELTVRAAEETLESAGVAVGIYSTPYMWRKITGGARFDLPAWVAGAPTDADAPSWCDNPAKDFTGGGVWLVQSLPVVFDVNYACDPAVADPAAVFHFGD